MIRDTLLTANAVLALDGVHTTTEGLKLMRRRSVAVGALAAATALLVSACGGSSGSSSSGGGGASTALEGVGPITLVQGKDTSNFVQGQLDKWNQQHPDQKVTLIELPEDADAQRQQMIQNANAKSDAYTRPRGGQRLDGGVRGQPLHRRAAHRPVPQHGASSCRR